jgi:hypothetical protein
MSVR